MTLDTRSRMKATGDVPENDDFSAAGKQCQKLEGALATGDQAAVQSAAKDLRLVFSILGLPPSTPAEQLAALERKSAGLKGEELFYALPDLAKRSFNAGKVEKAEIYSKQLLQMAPDYPHNWNHGNAVFSGNFVLGRIAVKKNQLNDAERYLLASAATEGSPQLNSFGPNMTLAKELLEKRRSDAVLKFLGLCSRFWTMDRGKLEEWSSEARQGGIPDFGANLEY